MDQQLLIYLVIALAVLVTAMSAYGLFAPAGLIERGIVDSAVAGGVEVADIHFHSGFDAMRAYTHKDNDRPDKASRPFAEDRAGFVGAVRGDAHGGAHVLRHHASVGPEALVADHLSLDAVRSGRPRYPSNTLGPRTRTRPSSSGPTTSRVSTSTILTAIPGTTCPMYPRRDPGWKNPGARKSGVPTAIAGAHSVAP